MTNPKDFGSLPALDSASAQHAALVRAHLRARIQEAGGFLPFDLWMQDALYAPGLGYYASGSAKFGSGGGDFTTAPELTPLFGQTLARPVAQVLADVGSARVLEAGAGSGALAAALIPALRALGLEPRYEILEVSPDLRARQADRLAPLEADVHWLDQPPPGFSGCVVANEVLDAMPVSRFRWDEQGSLRELGVVLDDGVPSAPFGWGDRPAPGWLREQVGARMPALPGYASEINPRAEAWVRGLGDWLGAGAALLLDYGFPRHEYYHPQRAEGTLMCHFRHRSHADPLLLPGLQDITSHVDFTAVADAALAGGLEVLGYTSQARFLMNAGLLDTLATRPADGATLSAAQHLLSEAEMGELFKVMAVGRGLSAPLAAFARGDRRHRL